MAPIVPSLLGRFPAAAGGLWKMADFDCGSRSFFGDAYAGYVRTFL